jgi:hypothetical protein
MAPPSVQAISVSRFCLPSSRRSFLLDAIAVPDPGVPVKIAVNWRGALALVDSR